MEEIDLDAMTQRALIMVMRAFAENLKYQPVIQTRSGRYFNLVAPTADMVEITDIAWGSAFICRFTGQSRKFYSVAEHCERVSRLVEAWGMDQKAQFAGLMHDAHEPFVTDLSAPLKQLCPIYVEYELRAERVVFEKFGEHYPEDWEAGNMPAYMKKADLVMLATEARDLMGADWKNDWKLPFEPLPLDQTIKPWSPEEARERFMLRFQKLTGTIVDRSGGRW